MKAKIVGTQEDSKTLILVCRRAFSRLLECRLGCEGFTDCLSGGHSLVWGAAVETKDGANEVFVVYGQCRLRQAADREFTLLPDSMRATGLFELYTVGYRS